MKKKLLVLFGIVLLISISYVLFQIFHFEAKVQTAGDAKISYYTRGTGEPLILLSGFGMTMQTWDPKLLQELSKSNKLIVIDYRGVGQSSGDVKDITHKQLADDVISVMDHLQIQKANILGWSMGSFVAQLVAQAYPDRVENIVLVSTAPGGGQNIDASPAVSDAIQDNLGKGWRESILPFLFYSEEKKNAYLERLTQAEAAKEIPQNQEEVRTEVKIAYERAFADAKSEKERYDKLKAIKNPTLIIVGEEDELLVPENSKRTKDQIPGSELQIIDQAGHAVLFEKPEETSKMITEFLNK